MFNLFNNITKLIGKLITVFVCSILACYLIIMQTYAASDPTRPLVGSGATTSSKPKTTSSFVLQSVIKSAQYYKVVINGKLLNRGDSILNYKIDKITATKVILTSNEKQITLFLFGKNKIAKVVNH